MNLVAVWIHIQNRLRRDDRGASLVEYVLLVALIAVVCIAAVTLLGQAAKGKFETTAGEIGKNR